MEITAKEMYPENSVTVAKLLNDMATMPIASVGMSKTIQFLFNLLFLKQISLNLYIKISFHYRGKRWWYTI